MNKKYIKLYLLGLIALSMGSVTGVASNDWVPIKHYSSIVAQENETMIVSEHSFGGAKKMLESIALKNNESIETSFSLSILNDLEEDYGAFRFGLYSSLEQKGYYFVVGSGSNKNLDLYDAPVSPHYFFSNNQKPVKRGRTTFKGSSLNQEDKYDFYLKITKKNSDKYFIDVKVSDGKSSSGFTEEIESSTSLTFDTFVVGAGKPIYNFSINSLEINIIK